MKLKSCQNATQLAHGRQGTCLPNTSSFSTGTSMLIVTGMHRSGTSLVCQLLNRLGVDFGDSSSHYASNQWNEEGYYEAREIVDLNSRMLTGFARTGSTAASIASQLLYVLMPSRHAVSMRAERRRSELQSLAQRFGSLAVKDPRFCLTLEHWRRVTSIECVIVCLREPTEIADSLWRRQHIPYGLGLRFWRYHMETLLESIQDLPTVFVSFNRLRGEDGDHETRRMLSAMGINSSGDSVSAAIRKTLRPELVHSQATAITRNLRPDSSGASIWRQLQERLDDHPS